MLIVGKSGTSSSPQKTGGTATLVVASSEASTQQKQRADYVCDGTADDVQINVALTQAANAGGGKVFLTEGGFTLADTIKIPSDTIFAGAGPNTKLIFATSVGDKTMITNNCGYTPGSRHATGNENITIRDMYIDGDKANRGSGTDATWTVGFNTVENLIIENLIVVDAWTSAIQTEFCTNVFISGNSLHNPGGDGIGINDETIYCSCFGNFISDVGTVGKSYGSPNGIEIQDGTHDISVFSNVIRNCSEDGIQISVHPGKGSCYSLSIFSNIISDCGLHCFNASGISGTPIADLSCFGNTFLFTGLTTGYGFYLSYTENCQLVSNTVSSSDIGGYIRESNVGTVISSNTIKCTDAVNNGRKALRLNGILTNIRIDGNFISNFGWKGLEINGSVNNMHVVNNHIVGCTHSSGACVRWDNPTSSLCVLNGNHLQGTHWSYDAATDHWNVLSANWTETWNTKDT